MIQWTCKTLNSFFVTERMGPCYHLKSTVYVLGMSYEVFVICCIFCDHYQHKFMVWHCESQWILLSIILDEQCTVVELNGPLGLSITTLGKIIMTGHSCGCLYMYMKIILKVLSIYFFVVDDIILTSAELL